MWVALDCACSGQLKNASYLILCLLSSVVVSQVNDDCFSPSVLNLGNLSVSVKTEYDITAKETLTAANRTFMTLYVKGNSAGAAITQVYPAFAHCAGWQPDTNRDVWFKLVLPGEHPEEAVPVFLDTCILPSSTTPGTDFDSTLCLLTCTLANSSCDFPNFLSSADDNGPVCEGNRASIAYSMGVDVAESCLTVRLSGFHEFYGIYLLRITYECPHGVCFQAAFGRPPNGGPVIAIAEGVDVSPPIDGEGDGEGSGAQIDNSKLDKTTSGLIATGAILFVVGVCIKENCKRREMNQEVTLTASLRSVEGREGSLLSDGGAAGAQLASSSSSSSSSASSSSSSSSISASGDDPLPVYVQSKSAAVSTATPALA